MTWPSSSPEWRKSFSGFRIAAGQAFRNQKCFFPADLLVQKHGQGHDRKTVPVPGGASWASGQAHRRKPVVVEYDLVALLDAGAEINQVDKVRHRGIDQVLQLADRNTKDHVRRAQVAMDESAAVNSQESFCSVEQRRRSQ